MKKSINQLIWESKKSGKPVNPWAICTSSVGREDKSKYEKCVMDVKKKSPIKENRINEYGGYDDANMYSKHAGGYMQELKQSYNDISSVLNHLDKLSHEVFDDKMRTELDSFLKSMVEPLNKLKSVVIDTEKKHLGSIRGGKPKPRDTGSEQ